MVHIIRAGSEESLEALARTDLIILDWESLTAVDRLQKEGVRRGTVRFLDHYYKRGKPFIASSEMDKDSVVNRIREWGWERYTGLALRASHLGTIRGPQVRILGRGLAHFRPIPQNPVLIGVDSKINKNSCAAYDIPLITVPAREENSRDGFSFVRLYRGEGFRSWFRLGQAVLDYQVF